MRVVVSASVTFDAGHRAAPPDECDISHHGHRWEIRATADGEEYISEMRNGLLAIGDELRNRDLAEMLPGVLLTPTGMAAYVRERINLHVPTLTSVCVDNGMWSSTVLVERR